MRGSQRRQRVLRALALALLAGALTGLVDALLALARGASSAAYLLAGVGTFAWVALPLSVPLLLAGDRVVAHWRDHLPKPNQRLALAVTLAWTTVVFAGLVTLGLAWTLREGGPRAGWRLAVFVVPLGLLAAAAVGRTLWRLCAARRGLSLALGLVLGLGTAGALVIVAPRLASIDLRFGWVLASALLGLGAAQWQLRRPPWGPRARAGVIASCALLAALGTGLMIRNPEIRIIAINYAPIGDRPVRVWARILDLDRDGHSALYGEGDCDPWRAEVHPFAVDLPGNGVDEDCHGGDLDPEQIRPRPKPHPEPRETPAGAPHILLISVDTLRADHLGIYGYARDTSPELDRWFADAAVFERAYSTSPVTDRAFLSLLGGLYPSMFTEALDYNTHIVADRRVLFAEYLHAAGYETVAINSYHYFDDFRMDQGFDHLTVLDNNKLQDARYTTRQARSKWARHFIQPDPPPLLLWVHYYEPHARYTPPDEHRLWDEGRPFELEDPMDLYDAEIHYVDEQIGKLLDALSRSEQFDNTVVIFFSDHGEEFLDHGGTRHARKLYEEQIRIPLFIRGPRWAPRRVREPVSLVDAVPTLLDIVGLPDPGDLSGRSLLPALEGGELGDHIYLMEQFQHGSAKIERLGAVRGPMKLILNMDAKLWELYDLDQDPAERINIHGDPRGQVLQDEIRSHWSRRWAAAHLAPPEGAF